MKFPVVDVVSMVAIVMSGIRCSGRYYRETPSKFGGKMNTRDSYIYTINECTSQSDNTNCEVNPVKKELEEVSSQVGSLKETVDDGLPNEMNLSSPNKFLSDEEERCISSFMSQFDGFKEIQHKPLPTITDELCSKLDERSEISTDHIFSTHLTLNHKEQNTTES